MTAPLMAAFLLGACGGPDGPTCPPAPATPVTLATAPSGAAVHFEVPADGACLGVTYEPELEPYRDQITAAVAAWSDIGCSRLRLCTPVSSDHASAPSALHFAYGGVSMGIIWNVGRYGDDPYYPSELPATGELSVSIVYLSSIYEPIQLVRAVGLALGLQLPRGSSVVSAANPDDPADAPTDEDVQTVCAIYGEPGYCD